MDPGLKLQNCCCYILLAGKAGVRVGETVAGLAFDAESCFATARTLEEIVIAVHGIE